MANTAFIYATNNGHLTTASSSLSSFRALRLHVDLDNYTSFEPKSLTFIAILTLLLHLILSRKCGCHLSEESTHVISALRRSFDEENAELLSQGSTLVRGHLSMGEREGAKGPRVGEIRLISDENDHNIVTSLAADIRQPFTSILERCTV